jgi:AraC-like DNA-binding protein
VRNTCAILKVEIEENGAGSVMSYGFEQFRHWHSEVEIIYVKKGYLLLELNRKRLLINENEFFIVASNVVHTFLKSTDDSILYLVKVPIENVRNFNVDDIETFYQFNHWVIGSKRLTVLFNDIMYADYEKFNQLYIISKLSEWTIYVLMDRKLILETIKADVVEESDITVKIRKFIERSLQEKITLGMLANHLNISENYCSTLIKQKTNFNFLEYVNQVRLREAERYLRTTNMNIVEICYETGFNSVQSFNRNFKKVNGLTPTEYRKGVKRPEI